MGCCGKNNKNADDFPYEKIEEFNRLKSEINSIIINKNNQDRKNINKLFDLFNKTSNHISEYEKEISILKTKNVQDSNSNDGLLQGLNEDLKQLKEFNHTLNDLIKEYDENEVPNKTQKHKESDTEVNFEIDFDNKNQPNEKKIIIEEINTSNKDDTDIKILKNLNNNNNIDNILENDFQNEFNIYDNSNNRYIKNKESISSSVENNIDDENLYYKKSIRRNKKSEILNRRTTSQKNSSINNEIFGSKDIDNEKNVQNNETPDKNENIPLEIKNNLIKLIFTLESGEKFEIQTQNEENFSDVLEKFGEKFEEYKNIDKINLFDGNNDITEKAKNRDIIASFGFNNEHTIQIKLKA